jgi:hypothetical protein
MNMKKYSDLLQILDEIGIPSDHIKPGNVNVNPTYYGPDKIQTIIHNLRLLSKQTQNIETIPKIVNQEDTAYIESTTLSISESAVNNVRDELNQKTLENDKTRAESMAKLAVSQ